MNDTKRGLQARIHDCENKLKRVQNGEYTLQCPEQVKKMLVYTIMYCEAQIFTNSL